MKSNPEKVLQKFWDSAVREFWQSLVVSAPTPRYASLYARQRDLAGIPESEREKYQGQDLYVGVKGVKMVCSSCLSAFDNVHPTEPAWCACTMPPTRLYPPKQILGVMEVVANSIIKGGRR